MLINTRNHCRFSVILCLTLNAVYCNAQLLSNDNINSQSTQADVIRSLPKLPIIRQPDEKQEKIDVLKPSVFGGDSPEGRTIRLSGFESEIDKDVTGYALVSKYFPMQLTQQDWKRVSEKIWEGYRDLGKLVRVDLVADQKDFIVSISLLRIRKITVMANASSENQISDEDLKSIKKIVSHYISEGQIADLFSIKKFLLQMDYRAKEIVATQIISNKAETVDITFMLSKRVKAALTPWQVGVDNYGLNSFGKYRFTGRYSAPLMHAGDNLGIQVLLSKGQEFAGGRYDFPIGYTPLRGSIWANFLHYKVSAEPTSQDGQAKMAGLDLSYPTFFRDGGFISTSLGYEFKSTTDNLHQARNNLMKTAKWINNLHIRSSGENFLKGKATFLGDLTIGNLKIGGDGVAKSFDKFFAQASGNFLKFYAEGNFLQGITPSSSVELNFKGQLANKNLDSLEKFSFGGINAVRAYNSDVGSGDEGALISINYAIRLPTKIPVRAGVFYDHAFVKVNRKPWPNEFDGLLYGNNYQINGAGFQLAIGYKQLMLSTALARPVTKKPIAPNQGWRFWTQITYSF